MSTITVSLGVRSYPLIVESALLPNAAEHILSAVKATSAVILSHPHLAQLYADPIVQGLQRQGVCATVIDIPAGERYKRLSTVSRIYDRMLDAGLDRKSVLITLGGGVIGDMGGYAAATYLRGIPFVQVPTSLLAQVDASVGGKTAVDLPRGKNLVGAFHQPRAVLIDISTLKTLPARELRAGLAEILKHGIIRDERYLAATVADMRALLKRDSDALERAVIRSCEIKAEVVGLDETEQGLRAILNFGHTVGHALEAVTGYSRYKHGEAVAIGMISAGLIGEQIGVTPREVTTAIRESVSAANLPTAFPDDVAIDPVIEAMTRDKKTVGGKVNFVLAKRIGEVFVTDQVPVEAVRSALLQQMRL